MLVQGDSISAIFNNAWQTFVTLRTGIVQSGLDARSGRGFPDAFECWGTPQQGGVPTTFHASYVPPISASCGQQMVGFTDGETFADSLKTVDIVVIQLGNNTDGYPLGAAGDATTTKTQMGALRWVVETYLSAKPGMRALLVTPQYSTNQDNQPTAAAMVAYGASVGVPVINMFALGGVNAITAPALLRDYAHPSDLGFSNFYGPVVSQAIAAVN